MANETKSQTPATTPAQPAKATPPTGTTLTIGPVRFSYAHVWQPTKMSDGTGQLKYSVSILIPKSDTALVEQINKAIELAKQDGIAKKWGGKLPVNLKMPLRDGDKERQENPEYAGHWFVSASSTTKPGIVDKKLQAITDETEFYSGVYGKANVNFYAFAAAGSKGVACGLNHLQKLRDGEALSGRGRAEDAFEAVEDDEEDLIGG